MLNNKVYCQIRVCSWFVIILKCAVFQCQYEEQRMQKSGMVQQVADLPTSYYIVREITARSMLQSTEPQSGMLQPLVELILRFHGVYNLYAVLIYADNLPRHLLTDRKAVGEYFRQKLIDCAQILPIKLPLHANMAARFLRRVVWALHISLLLCS